MAGASPMRQAGMRSSPWWITPFRKVPVVSTTRGIVTRVGVNRLGGQIVGVLGPGLEWHYYAHLERFGSSVRVIWCGQATCRRSIRTKPVSDVKPVRW